METVSLWLSLTIERMCFEDIDDGKWMMGSREFVGIVVAVAAVVVDFLGGNIVVGVD